MTFAQFVTAVLAAGGGGAVIAWLLIKSFGEKWLDSKFAGRLQELRHEHERQMEAVRLEGSRTLDRSARLSEREFDVSAEAWSLVYDAYIRTMSALPGLRQYDDFTKLSDELARLVAEKNAFEKWEVEELLAKPKGDRNSYFSERRTFHEVRDAKRAIRDAANFVAKKALFLEKTVHQRLEAFVNFAWKAIVAREIVMEARGLGLDGITRDDNDFRANADAQVKELEELVRTRFWPASPPEKAKDQ